MSDSNNSYDAINDTGKTLANLLFNNLVKDSKFNSSFNKNAALEKQVTLASPEEIQANLSETSPKLCIYLYNVTEFSPLKNNLPFPPKQNPPLYLTLHYLITPFTQETNKDQTLISKIIQTFLDNPVLRGTILQGTLVNNGEDLRVTLNSLSIDELSKLWTVFSMPYKLSLSYSVSPVKIEPSWQPEGKLVIEKTALYKQKKPGET